MSRALRGHTDKTVRSDSAMGARMDSGGDEDVPWSIQDDPEDLEDSADGHDDVEVKPGGETEVRQSRSIAHGHADMDTTSASDGSTMDTLIFSAYSNH